jgi:predicted GTPase
MVEYSSKSSYELGVAALVGKTGVGKTHLYNKLCLTTHSTKYSVKSLTFEIRKSPVSHGKRSFDLLDLPGNDSDDLPI